MRTIRLAFGIVSIGFALTSAQAALLGEWNFNDDSSVSNALVPSETGNNLSLSGVTAGPDLTGDIETTGANHEGGAAIKIEADNIDNVSGLDAMSNGNYLAFSVSPADGYMISITDTSYWHQARSYDPNHGLTGHSELFYTTETDGDGLPINWQSAGTGVDPRAEGGTWSDWIQNTDTYALTNVRDEIFFRLAMWDSSGLNTKEQRFDLIEINGIASEIPEPASWLLLAAGTVLGLRRRRQKRDTPHKRETHNIGGALMTTRNRISTTLSILAIITFSAFSTQAAPAPFSITTLDGDGADLGTSSNNATTNYGDNNGCRISHDGPGANRGVAYLRFDTGGAVMATVSDPTVTFSFSKSGDDANPGTFEIWGMVDGTDADARPDEGGWKEDELTQRNAPMKQEDDWSTTFTDIDHEDAPAGTPSAYGIKLGEFDFGGTNAWKDGNTMTLGTTNSVAVGSGSVSFSGADGNSLGVNMTSFLQADTNGVVTFGFRQVSRNNRTMYIWSKERSLSEEDSPAPVLAFNAEPIPEPASLAVLLLGLLLTQRRRTMS